MNIRTEANDCKPKTADFWNYFVWSRITDEGLVPEMRIWSILLIISDFKLGDNTFVIEWFAGINCIILWSQI